MSRKEELIKIINSDELLMPLVDKIVYLENQLSELEKLPFYKVNPDNPLQQKILPAARLYKEILQQYTNCLKIVGRASGLDDSDEESPLRKWVRSRMDGD